MDPLTILAAANAAVAAVKTGCQLYKDVKGAYGNVREVLKDLEQTFHKRYEGKVPPPEAVKQYNQERARVNEVVKHDPNDVISQVGEHLGKFFEAFDQIEHLFWEEEQNARQVYTGKDSVGKRALQRVLIRTRLEKMQTEMRETMVYHSPAELGDLWTRFEKMREQIVKEQEIARAKQAREDAEARWLRRKRIQQWKIRAYEAVGVLIVILYFWSLLWSIKVHQEILRDFL